MARLPSRRRTDQRQGDRLGGRWAAGDPDVDREQLVQREGELGRVGEHVAAEGAVAEGGDAARLRHRRVGGEQGALHPPRHRPGDEEDVGVTGGGDDVEAEALQVVLRRGGGGQLVLAGVAGAGVDMADRQRVRAAARRQGRFAADPLEMAEEDEHQRSAQA